MNLESLVLILVVVEDGLVHVRFKENRRIKESLNPCCSGRWSRTCFLMERNIDFMLIRLNPCCSGRWSRTIVKVSVLLLIKVCLNPCCSGRWSRTQFTKLDYMCKYES